MSRVNSRLNLLSFLGLKWKVYMYKHRCVHKDRASETRMNNDPHTKKQHTVHVRACLLSSQKEVKKEQRRSRGLGTCTRKPLSKNPNDHFPRQFLGELAKKSGGPFRGGQAQCVGTRSSPGTTGTAAKSEN